MRAFGKLFALIAFSILIFLFSVKAEKRLDINILGYRNGVGLNKDIDILMEELTKLGANVRFVSIQEHVPPQLSDINVFIDVYEPYFFPFAERNYLLPNPEWCYFSKDIVASFDMILCKTKEAKRIYEAINPNSEFISFTCLDYLDESVAKNYKKPLHLAGASIQKGTDTVAKVFIDNPHYPLLHLVRHKGNAIYPEANNLKLIYSYLSDNDLNEMRNSHGLHLCPSLTEGFGHYIFEAMSASAVVITTNAPPMNEFISDSRCLVDYHQKSPWNLATSYYVDPQKLDLAVANLLSLSEDELKKIGNKNREFFLKNDAFFKKRLAEIFRPDYPLKNKGEAASQWQKSDYIWNLGIASSFANLGYGGNPFEFFKNYYNLMPRPIHKLKKGDLLWLRAVEVENFVKNHLHHLKEPLILLICDGDESFPSILSDKTLLEKLLLSDKILHIFAQNCDYKGASNKISHFPIGIDFHSIAYRGGWFGEPAQSPHQQEIILKDLLANLQPTHLRKLKAYIDFHLADSMREGHCKRYLEFGEDRTTIFNKLLKTNVIDYGAQLKRSDLWKIKGQYAFSISPHGNGLDCHRTWEDLALGCIVIVKTSPLDPLYEGLPVVIVKDWSEVTEDNLKLWLNQFKDAFTNPNYREKLTHAYWAKKINEKQGRPPLACR